MYDYVKDKLFLKEAQSFCSGIVKEVEAELRNTAGINSLVFLIGSGAKNLLTENSNEGIDFDYNLNLLSCLDLDEKTIKEEVRKYFNKVMRRHRLNDVEDSKSSLTTKQIIFESANQTPFHIDLAIVRKNESGAWERLIHEKNGGFITDRYYWNIVRNSEKIDEKAEEIKRAHLWDELRQVYLEKKNMYLKRRDQDHTSFVCYTEAVNEVYQETGFSGSSSSPLQLQIRKNGFGMP